MTEKHVDFVAIRWSLLEEQLIERLPADHENAEKCGDYAYYSLPHSMDDCPFRDSRRLPLGAFSQ